MCGSMTTKLQTFAPKSKSFEKKATVLTYPIAHNGILMVPLRDKIQEKPQNVCCLRFASIQWDEQHYFVLCEVIK
jgi:hypothetical protein